MQLSTLSWPTADDYHGAVRAILRLQRTYLLTSDSLISGSIHGLLSRSRLEADDMYELGKMAAESDHYYASEWLKKAVECTKTAPTGLSKEQLTDACIILAKIYNKVWLRTISSL